MTELNPKFKKGDIVIRNHKKPKSVFESIKSQRTVEIKKIEKMNDVYFYQCTKTSIWNNSVLYPQSSFDELYDLDIIYQRGLKINKILKNLNEK